MTATTTWAIKQLDCKAHVGDITDYVITAHWTLTVDDGITSDSIYGAVNFKEDSDKSDYIPFSELTSDLVIGWVKQTLGEEKVKKFEEAVISKLAPNLIVQPPLPWA
jgi:hypothetical protein